MELLARFVVQLADLVEAEGRAVRASTFRILTAVVIFMIAAAMSTAGAALVLLSVYLLLMPVSTVLAAVITGMLALSAGGALLWIARRMDR
jgi:hypothetical protein